MDARIAYLFLSGALLANAALAQYQSAPDDTGLTIAYHLGRLTEPKMWKSCKANETTYRVLEIPPNRNVSAVRVARTDDEITFRTVTSTLPDNTAGAFGSVEIEMWENLEKLIAEADFWNMDSEWNVWRPDGTEIYIEGCKNGQYHVAKREPFDPDISDLMEFFSSFPSSKQH